MAQRRCGRHLRPRRRTPVRRPRRRGPRPTAREEIDALNVYPVPDGDTGTNMFLTVEAARDALAEALAEAPG